MKEQAVDPLNHNHDTKYDLMCHSVPVFLRACFNPWLNAILYRDATKRAACQMLICTQTCIIHVENVLTPRQLWTYFVESHTQHFQYQSTTRRRNTETDHISFVPVMSTNSTHSQHDAILLQSRLKWPLYPQINTYMATPRAYLSWQSHRGKKR
jgi:hypothetical protein